MSFDPFAPADGAAPGVRFDNVGAHHEDPHPKGDGALWSESWYLDFVDPDRGVAGYVRLGLQPNQGVAWYWACLVGPDRPLVTVIDNGADVPGYVVRCASAPSYTLALLLSGQASVTAEDDAGETDYFVDSDGVLCYGTKAEHTEMVLSTVEG
mgnify:CR=1 FL=1